MCAVHNTLGGHNWLLGDFLCIAGAFAQSLSLVGEEFIIKGELIIIEYMAMLGFGGAIAASIQLLVAITSYCNSYASDYMKRQINVTCPGSGNLAT